MAHDVLETLKPTLLSDKYDSRAERSPNIPTRDKINDLRHKAQVIHNDSDKFELVGLNADTVRQPLLDAADALESTVLLHQSYITTDTPSEKVMDQYGPVIEPMRNEILARLVYISKQPGHSDIKDSVEKISQNNDIADTIIDLGSCYEVALVKVDAMAARNYSLDRIEEVGRVFKEVSKAYPIVKADEKEEREAMLLRNRAFWYAMEQERILREDILPMVFWDDHTWVSRYANPSRN